MGKCTLGLTVGILLAFSSGPLASPLPHDSLVNLVQWTEESGGNGHWYGIIAEIMWWDEADSVARTLKLDTLNGYLATVTSFEENIFIMDSVIANIVNTTTYDEYCLGGWVEDDTVCWVTGEASGWIFWAFGQPAPYLDGGPIMMWGNSATYPGWFGTWEIWYYHHGLFWSIVEFSNLEDTDSDSTPNAWDNCPLIANHDQTDFDYDGVGDNCDNCPENYNSDQLDSDHDGLGDVCDHIWTAVDDEHDEEVMPSDFVLQQNSPNPFNPETVIEYLVPVRSHVIIAVYNLLGQRVTVLVDRELSAGYAKVCWDGQDDLNREVSSGVYFYRLESGSFSQTRKMLLLK